MADETTDDEQNNELEEADSSTGTENSDSSNDSSDSDNSDSSNSSSNSDNSDNSDNSGSSNSSSNSDSSNSQSNSDKTVKIKCKDFCPYNKKFSCPFGDDGDSNNNNTENEESNSEIESLDEIKFKARTRTPLPRRKRDDKEEWMTFTGVINISNVFESYDYFSEKTKYRTVYLNIVDGIMTDISVGEFSLTGEANGLSYKGERILELTGDGGIFLTYDKECDFGGNINVSLNLTVPDDNEKNTNKKISVSLSGEFETDFGETIGLSLVGSKSFGGYWEHPEIIQTETIVTRDRISFTTSM